MILSILFLQLAAQQPDRLFERARQLFHLLGDSSPIISKAEVASNGRLELRTELGSFVWWFPGQDIGGFFRTGVGLEQLPNQKRPNSEVRAGIYAVYQALDLTNPRGLDQAELEWEAADPISTHNPRCQVFIVRFVKSGVPFYNRAKAHFDHGLGLPIDGSFLHLPLPSRTEWGAKVSDLSAGTVAHAWARSKVERLDALVESDAPELVWLDPRYSQHYGRTSVEAEYLELCWKVRFLAHDSPVRQIGEVLVDARTGKVLRTFRAPLSSGGPSPAKPEAWGAPKRIEFGGKAWKVAKAEETTVPAVAGSATATIEFADGLRTLAYDPRSRVVWSPGLDKAWKVRLGARL